MVYDDWNTFDELKLVLLSPKYLLWRVIRLLLVSSSMRSSCRLPPTINCSLRQWRKQWERQHHLIFLFVFVLFLPFSLSIALFFSSSTLHFLSFSHQITSTPTLQTVPLKWIRKKKLYTLFPFLSVSFSLSCPFDQWSDHQMWKLHLRFVLGR